MAGHASSAAKGSPQRTERRRCRGGQRTTLAERVWLAAQWGRSAVSTNDMITTKSMAGQTGSAAKNRGRGCRGHGRNRSTLTKHARLAARRHRRRSNRRQILPMLSQQRAQQERRTFQIHRLHCRLLGFCFLSRSVCSRSTLAGFPQQPPTQLPTSPAAQQSAKQRATGRPPCVICERAQSTTQTAASLQSSSGQTASHQTASNAANDVAPRKAKAGTQHAAQQSGAETGPQ